MSLSWDAKDPNEVLDYDLNWAARLSGDTIVTSTWLLADGALVIDSDEQSGTATKVWLSGGAEGVSYTLTNRVVTSGNRTMDESVRIKIKSR
ncbi:hypothetical protein N8A98_06835 [Devosia neptuniae]|uniref:Uncharacterized protein n=1 Tax=Devosia neptuniae TaxID=191302 RepID=A0ABY6CF73_9HYPH|nr:hypothetical protein [Devosia neptuniae]UXN70897.1 hypothetical protein N8A98_06835 [Devosia neptuniae]